MPRMVVVELGEREFTIRQRSIRESKAWRESLAGPFQELVGVLEGAGDLELSRLGDLAGLVRLVAGRVIGAVELVLDLLFEYSPELASEREWIEANAYDDEALDAFVEVLKLAYPFGRLAGLLQAGPRPSGT